MQQLIVLIQIAMDMHITLRKLKMTLLIHGKQRDQNVFIRHQQSQRKVNKICSDPAAFSYKKFCHLLTHKCHEMKTVKNGHVKMIQP